MMVDSASSNTNPDTRPDRIWLMMSNRTMPIAFEFKVPGFIIEGRLSYLDIVSTTHTPYDDSDDRAFDVLLDDLDQWYYVNENDTAVFDVIGNITWTARPDTPPPPPPADLVATSLDWNTSPGNEVVDFRYEVGRAKLTKDTT